jgi:wyosine [tRNA(Phe)-imidazoG37] synthetase (radical SAM superfamily)
MSRKEYVPVDKVTAELDAALKKIPKPDYITFSGAGEPTLNSGIGRVIDHIKKYHSECPVCLLTNGLLLGDTTLQKELSQLDLIIPSLDASSEEEYSYINRPYPGETLEKLFSGLCSFRRNVPVKMALEIFVVPGINDSDESIDRFYRLVKCIEPDLIHLNTLDRHGVIAELSPASRERMEKFATVLGNIAPAEIFGPTKEPHVPHK